ncbi:MAG: class I SAM-dependent methyltransferase [Thermoflexibacteraceae bacterium]
MTMFRDTEVTSYTVDSDNVLNQRLLFAYLQAANMVQGDILEVGCGAGKGTELFTRVCKSYTAIDKNDKVIAHLQAKYPQARFINSFVPPFPNIDDKQFDYVVTLQVIEHIENDHEFLKEIYRVLRHGGKAIISTPNKQLSLTRNPWHVREYVTDELRSLLSKYFDRVVFGGVLGSNKVMEYQERNKKSIAQFKKFDIFDFENRLPRQLLQIPYDILNRINRNKLKTTNDSLVASINQTDFAISTDTEKCLDFFCIVEKR